MGGEEAKRVLLVYLRDDSTRSYGQIANGLAALSLIDRDVTTATARAIYAGGRAEFMDPKTLEVLRSQGDIKD